MSCSETYFQSNIAFSYLFLTHHSQGKERIEVINAKIESAVLPYFNLCVINTSFSLVTPLLFKMILHAEPFRYVYAFCMRDLALSIAAKCSEEHYSRISINMQLFC